MGKITMMVLLLLAACVPEHAGIGDTATEEQPEHTSDIFIGKWWEITEGISHSYLNDACFLLYELDHEGGSLLKYREENEWPYFTAPAIWDYTDEDGVFVINEEYEASISRKGNRCWNIEHSVWSAVACECSLDVERVARWTE